MVLAPARAALASPPLWISAAVAVSEAKKPPEPMLVRPEDFAGAGDMPLRGHHSGWVSFTFDDGPSAQHTPKILDTLAAYHVPATFFVIAKRFSKGVRGWRTHRRLLTRMVDEGHAVGNHTYSHRDLRKMRLRRMKGEVKRAEELLTTLLGKRPFLFRPPFGRISRAGRRVLRENQHTITTWNIDTVDYRAQNDDRLRAQVVSEIVARNGGIVLFHDTKQVTAQALPGVLSDLFAANCERLAEKLPPIIPVPLHYFVANADGTTRTPPPDVKKRTMKYQRWLKRGCQAEAEAGAGADADADADAEAEAEAEAEADADADADADAAPHGWIRWGK